MVPFQWCNVHLVDNSFNFYLMFVFIGFLPPFVLRLHYNFREVFHLVWDMVPREFSLEWKILISMEICASQKVHVTLTTLNWMHYAWSLYTVFALYFQSHTIQWYWRLKQLLYKSPTIRKRALGFEGNTTKGKRNVVDNERNGRKSSCL